MSSYILKINKNNKKIKEFNSENIYEFNPKNNKNIKSFIIFDKEALNKIFMKKYLVNYKKLIFKFLEKVKIIYFAYIYDVASKEKRSLIDNIESVKELFRDIKVKKFKSALLNVKTNTEDAVLIKEE